MTLPLEDYAMLSDLHTAALVGRNGSIDWLCLPRFDSGACFAALLGDERNDCWQIAPEGGGLATRRRYRTDTLVLEQEWDTAEGTVRVVDLMPPSRGRHDVVRIVEGVSGRVRMHSELRLRFDYGRSAPWVQRVDRQTIGVAGPDSVALSTPAETYGRDMATHADLEMGPGDRVPFVLTWFPSHQQPPRPAEADRVLELTERYWRMWAARCSYHGRYRDAVIRSLLTLKGLTYLPTGGIVAAPTTSLPEDLGGERNWDYRFCWLRDAAITLDALVRCGYVAEAAAWREWLLRAVGGTPDELQVLYGVAGERRLPESELPWLPGYANSAPVRIGNAAATQRQLDVYGEVLGALALAREHGIRVRDEAWRKQKLMLEALEGSWQQPDEGIWEVRGDPRHFTHSKVLAWVAVDRMIRTVEQRGDDEAPLERWRRLRGDIHAQVCAKAWDADVGAFTQSYGDPRLDAAVLQIPIVDFLPPDDPRVVATVEAIRDGLDGGRLIHRYATEETDRAHGVDGVRGDEGAFLACSFWLVQALARIGQRAEAGERFEHLLSLRNDVGLLAEEYDVRAGRQVGNFPQAFSHVPLVTAALELDGG